MTLIDPEILAILRCPVSGGPLELDEAGERLLSPQAKLAFPIRGGIAVLLADEAIALEGEAQGDQGAGDAG